MGQGPNMLAEIVSRAFRWRRAICAPPLPDDLSQATFAERKRYVIYQMRTLRRLSTADHLTPADREAARERAVYIRELLRAHPLLDDLSRCIEETRTAWDPPGWRAGNR